MGGCLSSNSKTAITTPITDAASSETVLKGEKTYATAAASIGSPGVPNVVEPSATIDKKAECAAAIAEPQVLASDPIAKSQEHASQAGNGSQHQLEASRPVPVASRTTGSANNVELPTNTNGQNVYSGTAELLPVGEAGAPRATYGQMSATDTPDENALLQLSRAMIYRNHRAARALPPMLPPRPPPQAPSSASGDPDQSASQGAHDGSPIGQPPSVVPGATGAAMQAPSPGLASLGLVSADVAFPNPQPQLPDSLTAAFIATVGSLGRELGDSGVFEGGISGAVPAPTSGVGPPQACAAVGFNGAGDGRAWSGGASGPDMMLTGGTYSHLNSTIASGSLGSMMTSAFSAAGGGVGGTGGEAAMQPLRNLEATLGEMQQMALVGSGSGGCVYIGRWRGVTCAIKFIVSSTDDQLIRSQREALLSRLASHPHVVQTYATSVTRLIEQMFRPRDGMSGDASANPFQSADPNISHDLLAGFASGSWVRGEVQRAMHTGVGSGGGAGAAAAAGVASPAAALSGAAAAAAAGSQPPLPTILEAPGSSRGSVSVSAPWLVEGSGRGSVAAREGGGGGGGAGDSEYGGGPCSDQSQPLAAACVRAEQRDQSFGTGSIAAQSTQSAIPSAASSGLGAQSSPSHSHGYTTPHGSSGPATVSARVLAGAAAAAVAAGDALPPHTQQHPQQHHPDPGGAAAALLPLPEASAVGGDASKPAPAACSSDATNAAAAIHDEVLESEVLETPGTVEPPPGALGRRTLMSYGEVAAVVTGGRPTGQSGGSGGSGGGTGGNQQGAAQSGAGASTGNGGQTADSFDASFVRDHQGRAKYSVHEVLRQLGAQEGQFLTMVVMEYCDGGSLLAALKEGPFHRDTTSWSPRMLLRSCVRTALEVAHGMQHLHLSGLVHGDLKPGNVLLKGSNQDKRGFVAKVSDLGIAHPVGAAEEMRIDDGQIGSISYMAPEAFRGRIMKASDVYSFGVLLWQLMLGTGAAPYEGLHPIAIALGTSEGRLQPRWPPGSFRPLQRLGELCTQFEPGARPSFKSVVGALEKLERHMQRLAAGTGSGNASTGGSGGAGAAGGGCASGAPTPAGLAAAPQAPR